MASKGATVSAFAYKEDDTELLEHIFKCSPELVELEEVGFCVKFQSFNCRIKVFLL